MKKALFFFGWLVLAILVGGLSSQANELTLQSAVYYFPDPELDSLTLVEFQFSVNRDDFEFFRPDSTGSLVLARVYAEVKLLSHDGLAVDSAKTYFTVTAFSPEDALKPGMKVFNNLQLLVRPGEYSARVTVIDAVSKRRGEAFFDKVQVEPILKQYLNIGGPILAYSAKYVGKEIESLQERLVHNGFIVYPDPLGVYSTSDTAAVIYAELYNVQGKPEDSPLKIEYRLESELGRVVQDYGFKMQERAAKALVLRESLDISHILEGTYYLRLMVSDSMYDQSVVRRIPLILIEPKSLREVAARQQSSDPYDSLSVQDKVNVSWHEMNPNQQSVIRDLSDSGKINYLAQFWREHDDQPLTRRIERREELVKRYRYANQRYSTDFEKNDGWLTDRGRTYLIHGAPDRIQSQEMPTASSPGGSNMESTAPYEVWSYFQIEEGKVVVFVDYDGMGEYTLAHSTFDGELYSDYWNSVLKSIQIDLD